MSSQTAVKGTPAKPSDVGDDLLQPQDGPVTTTGIPQYIGPLQIINRRAARFFGINGVRMSIAPNDVQGILPSSEEGEILGLIFDCNNPNMIIEIVLSGDSDTSYSLNDLSVADMVAQGRGIGGGDAANLPSGQSQDVTGHDNNVFPYVSRYNNSTALDFTGEAGPKFSVMYTPSVPARYTGIIIRVRNNDPTVAGTMLGLTVNRIVYVTERKLKERPKGMPTYKPVVGEQYQIQNP